MGGRTVPQYSPLQYPVLSDAKGEARKAYHIGRGLLGLVDARVTVVIDAKGTVRWVMRTPTAHVRGVLMARNIILAGTRTTRR